MNAISGWNSVGLSVVAYLIDADLLALGLPHIFGGCILTLGRIAATHGSFNRIRRGAILHPQLLPTRLPQTASRLVQAFLQGSSVSA